MPFLLYIISFSFDFPFLVFWTPFILLTCCTYTSSPQVTSLYLTCAFIIIIPLAYFQCLTYLLCPLTSLALSLIPVSQHVYCVHLSLLPPSVAVLVLFISFLISAFIYFSYLFSFRLTFDLIAWPEGMWLAKSRFTFMRVFFAINSKLFFLPFSLLNSCIDICSCTSEFERLV